MTVSAGQQCKWTSGYKSYNNTTSWASIVHEYSWQDPSSAYPGTWYLYVKSTKLLHSGSNYLFQKSNSVPVSPASSGWHSA
jgi:hypothetical protein